MNFNFLIPAIVISLAGCVPATPPVSNNYINSSAPNSLSFAWETPSNRSACRPNFSRVLDFEITKTMSRGRGDDDQGRNYVHYFGIGLAQTLGGINREQFKEHVLSVAEFDAFVTPDYSKSWTSPQYVQSNLVRMLAIYIDYMNSIGELEPAEVDLLVAWGNKFIPLQRDRSRGRSADSRAAQGVAMIAWGDLTANERLVAQGRRHLYEGISWVLESQGNLQRHDAHRSISTSELSLEDEFNIALAHAVEGAVMLNRSGEDVFNVQMHGTTLHDTIDWWVDVLETRPENFRGYRRASHNWHIGWIPIYLSELPNAESASRLRQMAREVSEGRVPMFEAISLGGATDCLWGF